MARVQAGPIIMPQNRHRYEARSTDCCEEDEEAWSDTTPTWTTPAFVVAALYVERYGGGLEEDDVVTTIFPPY
jgi:hypothetical protein